MTTKSFTATGSFDAPVVIQAPDSFDVSVSGTFTATILVKRRRPGDSAWRIVKTYNDPSEDFGQVATGLWEFTMECSAFTSGTAVCELSV